MVLLERRNLTKGFPLGESVLGGGATGEVRAVDADQRATKSLLHS